MNIKPKTETNFEVPQQPENWVSRRGNYWSTMKALSSEDSTKRFGPFSIGSNSASSSHDDMRENNPASESHSDDDSINDVQWSTSDLQTKTDTITVPVATNGSKNSVEPKQEDLSTDMRQEFDNNDSNFSKENVAVNCVKESSELTSSNQQLEESGADDNVHNHDGNLHDIIDDNDEEEENGEEGVDDVSDIDMKLPEDSNVPIKSESKDDQQKLAKNDIPPSELGVWTLPSDKNVCTLEEIRRGQVINKIPPNQCPVLGCGKKINENRAEPSPGTIASGLRTHVLFVHYANRKPNKKRKLAWTKRKSQPSPKKIACQLGSHYMSPSTSNQNLDLNIQRIAAMNHLHKSSTKNSPQNLSIGSNATKNNRPLPPTRDPTNQPSSLQSLMQANNARESPQLKQKRMPDRDVTQSGLNSTTSSLFAILAGLTQRQQQQQQQNNPPQQVSTPKDLRAAHNSTSVSQCSRTPLNNSRPANSSLLSLLDEQISGNSVASSLHNQLKKSLGSDMRGKRATAVTAQNNSTCNNLPCYQPNNNSDLGLTNSTSILNSLCSGNSDTRLPFDNVLPLNSFIESIALRTGSNIGSAGIVEAKRIVEKFTTSLICSSQTIADHYIAPFAVEIPQQKPEISPSDVVLAYKMMQKSHEQI